MVTARLNFDLSLYFVADPHVCSGRGLGDVVKASADGGVTMVQLRNKIDKEDTIRFQAEELLNILTGYKIPLIINDYALVAKTSGAQGVHLGQGDGDPHAARELLGGEAIIGRTAFTEDQIEAIDPAVIDYIGTGPFYATKTKPDKPVLGPEKFSDLVQLSPVPVVGIGGITTENAKAVMDCGADGVAMMRSISEADDPKNAAEDFLSVVRGA